MSNETLGMIETKGLVGAIEAADTMAKATNMVLVGHEETGSDLVMAVMHGDVGAVKVSVDADVAAASAMGEVTPRHVIPWPHSGTEKVLP